jgi:hypothetical protein
MCLAAGRLGCGGQPDLLPLTRPPVSSQPFSIFDFCAPIMEGCKGVATMHRILMLLALAALLVFAASGCSSDSTTTVSPPNEDLTPPAAPLSLSVSVKGDQVTVAWLENSELDLANYRVYRGVNHSSMSLTSTSDVARFVDTIDESGLFDLAYRVSAVDESNNESPLSTTVSITVDTGEPNMAEELTH